MCCQMLPKCCRFSGMLLKQDCYHTISYHKQSIRKGMKSARFWLPNLLPFFWTFFGHLFSTKFAQKKYAHKIKNAKYSPHHYGKGRFF